MPNSGPFQYSQGSAFVREGYLYYSPNCRRRVLIDPALYGNPDPFKMSRLNVSAFRQPVWWSEPWGWMSFIPLAPTFLSYPFEPFSWMPKIVPLKVSLEGNPDLPPRFITKYQMAHNDIDLWRRKEMLIVDAARQLRMNHGIAASAPPLPSSFGFDRPHRTLAVARCMIMLSRDWFGIWMGYLSFIIQQTSTLPTNRPTPSVSPHPHWYQQLLDDSSRKWSQPWLDGISSSPVCAFDDTVVRAGVVIPWAKEEHRRPPIDFFLKCDIPLFFPWTLEAENAISRDSRLEYLRPPKEIIQQALTFILSAPESAPLAALVIKRFCGVATEFRDPASVRVLKLQDSPSDVVALVREAFLDQHASLTEAEADEVLIRAMETYHDKQEEKAVEDATLPQQGMLSMENPAQQRLYTDWKDFFRARAARRPAIIQGASQKTLQTHHNRKLKPPVKNTQMFVWEKVITPGGLPVFTRKQAVKAEFEDLLEDEDLYVYDEIHNEWDIFPDFIVDNDSPPEEGIPRFCMAPPRQYVPYGDSDDEDEAPFLAPLDSIASPPRPRSPSAPPLPPAVSVESSSEVADEDNISLSTPIFEALKYNYGFTHPIVRCTSTLKLLDWRGVGLALGYMESLTSDQEDLSVQIFVSSLADAKNLPVEMDDLHPDNFTSLRKLFDFRDIMRLRGNLYVFHNLVSPDHDWLLGVTSAEALLYVIRYIIDNPKHNLTTIVHRLLKFGIPFNTLIHRRSNSLSYEALIRDRYRYKGYIFTSADFHSAMLSAKALLQGPVGRAALMRGGIIGRIAKEYLSLDCVFDGPSDAVVRNFRGFAVDSEMRGHQYWDDVLTLDDFAVICGSYTVYTGVGDQISYLSYFPHPREWDERNGFCWLEWTTASESLFQSILKRNRAGDPPQNATTWRRSLRGLGSTRRLLQANHVRSAAIVQDLCPVRSRQ